MARWSSLHRSWVWTATRLAPRGMGTLEQRQRANEGSVRNFSHSAASVEMCVPLRSLYTNTGRDEFGSSGREAVERLDVVVEEECALDGTVAMSEAGVVRGFEGELCVSEAFIRRRGVGWLFVRLVGFRIVRGEMRSGRWKRK